MFANRWKSGRLIDLTGQLILILKDEWDPCRYIQVLMSRPFLQTMVRFQCTVSFSEFDLLLKDGYTKEVKKQLNDAGISLEVW